jgi:hypothetical protein
MSFRVGTPVVVVKPVTPEQTMLGWTGVIAGREIGAGEEVQDPRDGMIFSMPKRCSPVLVDGDTTNTPWMIFSECLRKIEDPDRSKRKETRDEFSK